MRGAERRERSRAEGDKSARACRRLGMQTRGALAKHGELAASMQACSGFSFSTDTADGAGRAREPGAASARCSRWALGAPWER